MPDCFDAMRPAAHALTEQTQKSIPKQFLEIDEEWTVLFSLTVTIDVSFLICDAVMTRKTITNMNTIALSGNKASFLVQKQ